MGRLTPQILGWSVLTAFVAPAGAQDVQVKGAQVILQPKPITVEIVTIENRRNSPLMAWEIGLSEPGAGRPAITYNSDFTSQISSPASTSGPIKPNERRAIEVERHNDRDLSSHTVRLAVFADGYIEGAPDVIERWQKSRQERADDAAYWIRAFETMPETSEELARQHLTARAAERVAQTPRDPSGIRGQLSQRLRESPRLPGWLFAVLEPIRQEAQRQYAALTRPPTTAPALQSAAPVVLSSQRAVVTEFVALVKNLREVPIEAVGLEFFEPGEERPSSGQSADYCVVDRAASTRGSGPIAPGESREFRLNRKVRDKSQLPVVRIAFVIFDDLVFEGSAAQRNALLRSRERRADDIAFANAVRAEAAAKPPGEAHAFLVAKRAERVKQLDALGRPPGVDLLDELVEQARTSPERLRESAWVVQELERQRQQLLRHVKR